MRHFEVAITVCHPIRQQDVLYVLIMSVPLKASKSRFVVGSHVWVEDPDEAWMDGLVEQINGDELVVNCTSGKKVINCSMLCLFVTYETTAIKITAFELFICLKNLKL
jgi:hypothetical protein